MEDGTRCAFCGGPVAQPENGRPRRFCSDKCKRKDYKKRWREKNPPKPQREAKPIRKREIRNVAGQQELERIRAEFPRRWATPSEPEPETPEPKPEVVEPEEGGAVEASDEIDLEKMTVAELRDLSAGLGLSPDGDRDELMDRIEERCSAFEDETTGAVSSPVDETHGRDERPSPVSRWLVRDVKPKRRLRTMRQARIKPW